MRAAKINGLLFPAALVVLVALLLTGGVVFAHANLERSEPPDGGELRQTPAQLTLHFSQALMPNESWVAIRDASGADTQLSVTFDPADRKVMRAMTPALPPGFYTIRWQSLSAEDDDFAQGSYKLTVLRPDGSKPEAEGDGNLALYAIGGVMAALVGGLGVWYTLRRDTGKAAL